MPAMENEHYSLLCQCAGGKPAATLQWIWGGEKVNSKTWVVEQDDGSFISYAKLEFLASRARNNNLFQCEATNKAMWIAGTAPYTVSHTLIVHCKLKLTFQTQISKCESTRVPSGLVSFVRPSKHISDVS